MKVTLFKILFVGLVIGLLAFNWITGRDETIISNGQRLILSAVDKARGGDYHDACHDMQTASELLRNTKYFSQTAELKTKICSIADVIHELKPEVTI